MLHSRRPALQIILSTPSEGLSAHQTDLHGFSSQRLSSDKCEGWTGSRTSSKLPFICTSQERNTALPEKPACYESIWVPASDYSLPKEATMENSSQFKLSPAFLMKRKENRCTRTFPYSAFHFHKFYWDDYFLFLLLFMHWMWRVFIVIIPWTMPYV